VAVPIKEAVKRSMQHVIRPTFQPRAYQLPILKARANGVKRGVSILHRRAGKDLTMLNMLWVEALKRVGLYNYYFPTFSLGKNISWKGMDKEGRTFLSYIPPELVKDKNETDMRIELVNGSIIRIVGTENVNQNIIGINPIGCVFSEYSVQDPMAWELTRPILAENGGWAWFVYTPRGRNHGYTLYEMAKSHPAEWFSQLLTIKDTRLDDGNPVISPEFILQEIEMGMDPDLAQQEYYCSFDAPMHGAYYGRLLTKAFSEGRVTFVPPLPNVGVVSAWDIGVGDQTAIWFAQPVGYGFNIIDYYENAGEGFDHYAKVVLEKPYLLDTVILPHDAAAREYGTGRTIEEIALRTFRPHNVHVRVLPRLDIEPGIEAVRALLPRLRFDESRCNKTKFRGHTALDAIASYHKKWNPLRNEYENKPQHDWASNAADALRYLALGLRETPRGRTQASYATRTNPFQDTAESYETESNPYVDTDRLNMEDHYAANPLS